MGSVIDTMVLTTLAYYHKGYKCQDGRTQCNIKYSIYSEFELANKKAWKCSTSLWQSEFTKWWNIKHYWLIILIIWSILYPHCRNPQYKWINYGHNRAAIVIKLASLFLELWKSSQGALFKLHHTRFAVLSCRFYPTDKSE